MAKKLLAVSATGAPVYVGEDTINHMTAHSDVKMSDVAEAIKKLSYQAPFFIGPVDLQRVIGANSCVEVTAQDEVKMLRRKNRDGETPIVFNRQAEPTTQIVVGVCTDDDGLETLFTAFYGQLAPKEPWDPRLKDEEREESEAFWRTHALVYEEGMLA